MATYGPKDYDAERLRQLRELRRQSGATGNLASISDLGTRKLRKDIDVASAGQEYPVFYPQTPDDYAIDIDFNELVDDASVGPANDRPVPLTDIPTSSTNAKRPYTVAAGWQRYPGQRGQEDAKGTLTIMFRDGTLYNYYNVENSVWNKFRGSLSKGIFINRNRVNPTLNAYTHGPASLSGLSYQDQERFYRFAREAQLKYQQYPNRMSEPRARREGKQAIVPKSARGKAGYGTARSAARKLGQNPSTGGRNPR